MNWEQLEQFQMEFCTKCRWHVCCECALKEFMGALNMAWQLEEMKNCANK